MRKIRRVANAACAGMWRPSCGQDYRIDRMLLCILPSCLSCDPVFS